MGVAHTHTRNFLEKVSYESSKTFLRRKLQTVDKTKVFRQIDESFGQAFSKACAVEAAEASSRSAEREILFSAFLFTNFFFAPQVSKKKWGKLYNNSGHLEERMV